MYIKGVFLRKPNKWNEEKHKMAGGGAALLVSKVAQHLYVWKFQGRETLKQESISIFNPNASLWITLLFNRSVLWTLLLKAGQAAFDFKQLRFRSKGSAIIFTLLYDLENLPWYFWGIQFVPYINEFRKFLAFRYET